MPQISFPILMYHSIETVPKSTVMRSIHVPIKRFEFQMWMLKALGYKAVSLDKLSLYLDGKKEGKVVGLTFDDGYKNNLTNAAPILSKYNFSATCYLVSDCIGLSNVWDLDKGTTQSPLMKEEEVVKWLNFGMSIGAHTKTHPDLRNTSTKKAQKEIIDSKTDLEKSFNVAIKDFCYPYGGFNDELCKIVEDAGYHSAVSSIRGRAHAKSNKFLLPRIPINYHTLPHLFLTKLLTKYEEGR